MCMNKVTEREFTCQWCIILNRTWTSASSNTHILILIYRTQSVYIYTINLSLRHKVALKPHRLLVPISCAVWALCYVSSVRTWALTCTHTETTPQEIIYHSINPGMLKKTKIRRLELASVPKSPNTLDLRWAITHHISDMKQESDSRPRLAFCFPSRVWRLKSKTRGTCCHGSSSFLPAPLKLWAVFGTQAQDPGSFVLLLPAFIKTLEKRGWQPNNHNVFQKSQHTPQKHIR